MLAIILSILLELYPIKRLKLILYIGSIGLFFYKPILIHIYPLVLYNSITDYPVINVGFLIYCIFTGNIDTAILGLTTSYLGYMSHRWEKDSKENTRLYDDSREDRILLKDYNKELIEKREADIEIAILEKRNRISRRLHDSISHLVSGSILQV